MTHLVRAAVAVVLAALVSACASVPMDTPAQDALAKEFRSPPADRAHVYVYRNESLGGAVRQDVLVDGLAVGQTAAKVFLLIPVAPGQHTLTSESENTYDLPITAEGGRNDFVWQEVKMGILYARTKLDLVDEATGKRGVLECELGLPSALPPIPASDAPTASAPRGLPRRSAVVSRSRPPLQGPPRRGLAELADAVAS